MGSAFFFNAQAADTYDATKSTLTIPVLKVGETYYSNVIITLGNLNSTLPSTFSVIGETWLNEINELRWFLC